MYLQPDNQRVQFNITKWPLTAPTSLFLFLPPCHGVEYTILWAGRAVYMQFWSSLKENMCAEQFVSWVNSLICFIIWMHAQTNIRQSQDSILQELKCVAKLRPASAISQYCSWTLCKAKPHVSWVWEESLFHITCRLNRLGSVRRIRVLCKFPSASQNQFWFQSSGLCRSDQVCRLCYFMDTLWIITTIV